MDSRFLGRRHGVVLPVRVDPAGVDGPTQRQAAGPDWRRSSRGRYVEAWVEPTPTQRIAEVGAIMPRHASVTGWASLCWRGGWYFAGLRSDRVTTIPVPIAAPRRLVRPQAPFRLCCERWCLKETEVIDGLEVTSAVRSVCFEMRYATSLDAAVVAMCMASFHDLVSLEEAQAWVDLHPSYTGIERARQALPLAHENLWSPREPFMLETWERVFPRPLVNHRVFDRRGRHVATPDLFDPVLGVAAEYDGEDHLTRARRGRDVRREHDLRELGIETVTMTAEDYASPEHFLVRLRAAFGRAEARPGVERRWTTELPPWWVPTFTVEQRRALSPADQARLLAHRRPRTDTA